MWSRSGRSWGSPTILPAGSVCPNLLPISGRHNKATSGDEQVYLLSGGRENAAEGKAMAAPGCRLAWQNLPSKHGCQNFDVVLWAASASALQCGNNCSLGWRKYSISAVHNSLVAPDQPRFTREINDTRFQSSSYTSVLSARSPAALRSPSVSYHSMLILCYVCVCVCVHVCLALRHRQWLGFAPV